jgi:hypothetical protein
MADELMPDTPQVYYRAVSTDGWPVTVTLDSKLPMDQPGTPGQPGTTCKILAMPVAGFQPGQAIVATTPNTPGGIINAFFSLPAPALYTAATTRQGAETIRAETGTWATVHLRSPRLQWSFFCGGLGRT